jgi:hypothetical protein
LKFIVENSSQSLFRSLGDGQVDFRAIFSKLAQYDFEGWAVLEWESCVKSSEQGAKEGAPFIAHHIIQTAEHAFDDFAKSGSDTEANRRMLGLANRKESVDAGLPPNQSQHRRLRFGMVGSGPGAFIGAVHRIAVRLDDRYELLTAALSSNAERQFGRRRRTGYSAGTRYLNDPGHQLAQEDSIVLFSNRSRSIFPFACAFDDNIIRKYPTHCGEPQGDKDRPCQVRPWFHEGRIFISLLAVFPLHIPTC